MESYIAAAAKVRTLFGGILNESTYDDLIAKDSVFEISNYLKVNTVYSEVLENKSNMDLHRGNLEVLLRKQYFLEMNRIYKHIRGTSSKFFYDLNLDFEIDILKNIIRNYLIEGHSALEFNDLIFEKGQVIPLFDLIKSADIDELINKIRKTMVADCILPLLVEKNPNRIHTIETNLDLFYFDNAFNSANNYLHDEQLKFVKKYLGTKADLYNIVLILRGKKYFNWKREDIIPHITNNYNHIDSNIISKLSNSESLDECFKLLEHTKYKKIAIDNNFSILKKKYYLDKYVHRIRQTVDFKVLLYYFQLKKIDIENIITITEAVRYGYNKQETKKLIVYK
jgi:V/A-type H+-transporting ATPase subunit C